MIARAIVLALGVALAACTTVEAEPVTSSDVTAALSICPDVQPKLASDCGDHLDPRTNSSLAQRCEYGSNTDLGCNVQVGCEITFTAMWSSDFEADSLGCAMNQCPRTRADIADGAPCDAPVARTLTPVHEYVCGYAEGTCGCVAGAKGFAWKCVAPPSDPCPRTRPNLGRYCDHDDLMCDYGACSFEHSAAVVCASKRWQLAALACN
jgi:hypothetical protein